MIVNKRQLSEILGVSERTLTEWQKDERFPIAVNSGRGASNQYETAAVVEWMIQRAVNGDKQESARERRDRIAADRDELALSRELGQLVPAENVEETITELALAVRSTILQGNSKLKLEIDTLYDIDTDIELLNEHSREVLTKLSAYAANAEGDSSESGTEVRAAA